MVDIFRRLQGLEKGIKDGVETYKNIVSRKPEEELRTERIYLRVTKDEKYIIKSVAKLKHKSISDYSRESIFNAINKYIK